MHGDEPKSVHLAMRFIELITQERPAGGVVIVPIVNPDGYALRKRRNDAGVDINRNFPTANWESAPRRFRYYPGPRPASEPETRAIIAMIESLKPARIVTIHSINRRRHCNNYDGPAKQIARAMSRKNEYPVRASIGYACSKASANEHTTP